MIRLVMASLLVLLAACERESAASQGPALPSTSPQSSPSQSSPSAAASSSSASIAPASDQKTALPDRVAGPKEVPPPEVILGVTVNSNRSARVFTGWPVVVEATLRLTPEAKGNKTISGTSGPWSAALKLSCIGPDGQDVAGQFQPAFASKPSIELTEERSGLAVWILDQVTLPPGDYTLRVSVDPARVGNTLTEDLRSNGATLTVSASAPKPSADWRKCRATIDAALYKGDAALALAAAEAHLAIHPKDTLILARKANILRSLGKPAEALAALEAALAVTEAAKADVRPLLRAIDDLRDEMRGK